MGRLLTVCTVVFLTGLRVQAQLVGEITSRYVWDSHAISSSESSVPPQTQVPTISDSKLQGMHLERRLARNILLDQKRIWSSPATIRPRHLRWLVPAAGLTAGLVETDADWFRASPNLARVQRYQKVSDYGAIAMLGASAGLYVMGFLKDSTHARESGILAGEAAIDTLLVSEVMKYGSGRQRPNEGTGRGRFWHGGQSFPSIHAGTSWAIASVLAQEYPGPLSKVLLYGLASTVSLSRIGARQHFPSDVFIGSLSGWLIARSVYRNRHEEAQESVPSTMGGENKTISGTTFVPLDDPTYRQFERLASRGWIPSASVSTKPWSRAECTRLVEEAEEAGAGSDHEVAMILADLKREFVEVSRDAADKLLHLDMLYSRATVISGKPIRDGYHLGQTISNDFGRPYSEGLNTAIGIAIRGNIDSFGYYLRVEHQWAGQGAFYSDSIAKELGAADFSAPSNKDPFPRTNRLHIVEGYVTMRVRDWDFTAGKQSLAWGPSAGGGMIFSNNADPIPMVRISRSSPFKMPKFLAFMGPVRTEFFVGQLRGHSRIASQLGPREEFFSQPLAKQPILHGQRLSFKPTKNLEIGFSRTTIFGGPGLPVTSRSFFNSLFWFGNSFGGNDPGDRRSAFDLVYSLPRMRDWASFYVDSFTEDELSPIAYPRKSAISSGIYFNRIPGLAKLECRAEGVYTDIPSQDLRGFFYWNQRYRDGYTNAGQLLGSPIGRDSRGVQFWARYWFSTRDTIDVNWKSKWQNPTLAEGGQMRSITVRGEKQIGTRIGFAASAQYEQWRFPILTSVSSTDLVTSIQITYKPTR